MNEMEGWGKTLLTKNHQSSLLILKFELSNDI